MIYSFQELQSGTFTAVLKDELGSPIGSGDLLTLTLTITDQVTRMVINNRFKQNIFNENDVTIDESGNLSWTIQPEDNPIVTYQAVPGTVERHEVLFEWTWGVSKYSNELYYFDVTQTSEIGEVASDIYGTILDGDLYFSKRLNSDAWNNASTTEKYASLIEATRLIDSLNYLGDKTDENQALEFPRFGSTEIPAAIKMAAYELGIKLLDGFDPDYEMELLRNDGVQYDGVRESYSRGVLPEWIMAGIVSARAWRLLKPFLRDPRILKINRES